MRTWQAEAKPSVKFWPADGCSRKSGVSVRTGDRPTAPLLSLPTLFPIPATPSWKGQALAQASSPDTQLFSPQFSETLHERVLCGQARHGLASQLPGSKLAAPIHSVISWPETPASHHMPVPSSRTRDKTKKRRHRLLTGWVWGMVPKGRYGIHGNPTGPIPVTCLPYCKVGWETALVC